MLKAKNHNLQLAAVRLRVGPPSGQGARKLHAIQHKQSGALLRAFRLAFCFLCSPHCLLVSFFPLYRKWQHTVMRCTVVLQATRTKTLCRAACNFIIFSTRRWRCCHFFFWNKVLQMCYMGLGERCLRTPNKRGTLKVGCCSKLVRWLAHLRG